VIDLEQTKPREKNLPEETNTGRIAGCYRDGMRSYVIYTSGSTGAPRGV